MVLKSVLFFLVLSVSQVGFANELTHTLDCEFYFEKVLMMTLKTESSLHTEVGVSSDITFQRTPAQIENLEEPLADDGLFHFTLDEQQEKNMYVQIFDQLFDKDKENVFVGKITNPSIPFINVFEGFCVREEKSSENQ